MRATAARSSARPPHWRPALRLHGLHFSAIEDRRPEAGCVAPVAAAPVDVCPARRGERLRRDDGHGSSIRRGFDVVRLREVEFALDPTCSYSGSASRPGPYARRSTRARFPRSRSGAARERRSELTRLNLIVGCTATVRLPQMAALQMCPALSLRPGTPLRRKRERARLPVTMRTDLREGRENGIPLCCCLRYTLTEALRPDAAQALERGFCKTPGGMEYVPCGIPHKATVASWIAYPGRQPVLSIEP
jgi:hypothetical protein